MVMEISELTPRDCPVVSELLKAASVQDVRFDSADKLETLLRNHPNLSLIVREDEKIIAAVLCLDETSEGMTQHVIIDQAHQSAELECALVNAAIAKLEQRHYPVADLRFISETEHVDFWRSARWNVQNELPRPIQKNHHVPDPTAA